jgi:hypothetical protein
MLRAYGHNVIDLINQCSEVNTFVPALVYTFWRKPTEVVVDLATFFCRLGTHIANLFQLRSYSSGEQYPKKECALCLL